MFKKLATTAALALGMSAVANASLVTIEGVTFNTGDFLANTDTVYTEIEGASGSLGAFTAWGSFATTDFACNGCELTFFAEFGAPSLIAGGGGTRYYTGGEFSIYVDDTPDFNLDNNNTISPYNTAGTDDAKENAQDGDLWLKLVGHNVPDINIDNIFDPSVVSASFRGDISSVLTGIGYLDVVDGEGYAYKNFDLDSQLDGADIRFTTNFLQPFFDLQGVNSPFDAAISANGTGQFQGSAIPEPASLALFGLGLLGFAGMARRRKA